MNTLLCLATIVYFEARSEPLLAQQYVAETAIERAKLEKTTICRSMLKNGNYAFKKGQVMKETIAKELALAIAKRSLRFPKGKFRFFNERKLGKRFAGKKPVIVGKLIFY
jgi:spore germination cell wall hydrolase CwlJ-like protein